MDRGRFAVAGTAIALGGRITKRPANRGGAPHLIIKDAAQVPSLAKAGIATAIAADEHVLPSPAAAGDVGA